jgi:putative transposase
MNPVAAKSPDAGHCFPRECISQAVWLYVRFPLSLRMVEEMLAAHGITVSHETVRQWALRVGQDFASRIRRRLPRPSCAVPECDGAFSREQEDAVWQQVFTAQPARRRVFEPSSKRQRGHPLPGRPLRAEPQDRRQVAQAGVHH